MSKHNRQRRHKDPAIAAQKVHQIKLTVTVTKKVDGSADTNFHAHCATLSTEQVIMGMEKAAELLRAKHLRANTKHGGAKVTTELPNGVASKIVAVPVTNNGADHGGEAVPDVRPTDTAGALAGAAGSDHVR